jgi:outer membrane protein assembly factor BamA
LHRTDLVRHLAVLAVCAAAAAFVLVRELPEHEADATVVHASRPQEVQSVALDGSRGLPVAELRATLATHAGDQLDAQKLDFDRSSLQTALVNRGYLSAKVAPASVMFDSSGGAFVSFAIERGPLFHVRNIEVVGTTEQNAGVVTIKKGEVVRSDKLERARATLAERLVARTKLTTQKPVAANVAVKLEPDEAAAAVDVVLGVK